MHHQQIGNVVRRTAVARQPRAQQPPDVVREFGSRAALQLLDPLLQHGAQQGIGSGDPKVQVAGREDNRGGLLIEPDRGPVMAPERLTICRGGPGQEHLGRVPFGSAQGAQGVDGNGEGAVGDLLDARDRGLVDREAKQGRVACYSKRWDNAPVLDAQVRNETAQGVADGVGMLHQASDHPERQDCGPLADEKPEMRTVRAGHAQGEQPAQGHMRDHVRPILEKAWVEPCLPDDRIGIDAEIPQGRRDLLGDPQVHVTGGKRPPGPRRRKHDVVDHPHGCLTTCFSSDHVSPGPMARQGAATSEADRPRFSTWPPRDCRVRGSMTATGAETARPAAVPTAVAAPAVT